MKNNISLILFILMPLTTFYACKKKEPHVAFTNATMKPWFDTHCASCHASGASNDNDWEYDPADFNNTIKNNMSSIHNEVAAKKTMPEGTALSAAELQKFVDWYNAGFPAN